MFEPSATFFVKSCVDPSSDSTAGVILCTLAAATSESRTLEYVFHAAATPCLRSTTATLNLCASPALVAVFVVFMLCALEAVVVRTLNA